MRRPCLRWHATAHACHATAHACHTRRARRACHTRCARCAHRARRARRACCAAIIELRRTECSRGNLPGACIGCRRFHQGVTSTARLDFARLAGGCLSRWGVSLGQWARAAQYDARGLAA